MSEQEHLCCEGQGNVVFDLVDIRKAKPKNHVTGRWVPPNKTEKQATSSGQRPDGH